MKYQGVPGFPLFGALVLKGIHGYFRGYSSYVDLMRIELGILLLLGVGLMVSLKRALLRTFKEIPLGLSYSFS